MISEVMSFEYLDSMKLAQEEKNSLPKEHVRVSWVPQPCTGHVHQDDTKSQEAEFLGRV